MPRDLKLSILPLPGTNSFLNGYYGLEECHARGLLRIQVGTELFVEKLDITLVGEINTKFHDATVEFDKYRRKRTLFSQGVTILSNYHVNTTKEMLQIPFDLSFPLHEPIPHGFGPSTQLLPCPVQISGRSEYSEYSASIKYFIRVNAVYPLVIPFLRSSSSFEMEIPDFKVYDPRMLIASLNTLARRFKSHVGQKPLEYDVSISASTFCPGDEIRFSYTLLLHPEYIARGVRVESVKLILRESHVVGEGRCCRLDDSQYGWHGYPSKVKGNIDFELISQIEYPSIEPSSREKTRATSVGKDTKDLFAGRPFKIKNGTFVERELTVIIPKELGIQPTIPRPPIGSTDHICENIRPREASCVVRHSLHVVLVLRGASSIQLDANCYISMVDRKEVDKLIKEEFDIFPLIDYEREIGLSSWVPEYTEESPILEQSAPFQPTISATCNGKGDKHNTQPTQSLNSTAPGKIKDSSDPPAYNQVLVEKSTESNTQHIRHREPSDFIDFENPHNQVAELVDGSMVQELIQQAMNESIFKNK